MTGPIEGYKQLIKRVFEEEKREKEKPVVHEDDPVLELHRQHSNYEITTEEWQKRLAEIEQNENS